MTNPEHNAMLDVIKGTSRQIEFLQIIKDQQETIHKLERMTNGKPNKVEQAYFEQQNARLKELEGIVKKWIWEAFRDDEDIVEKTMYWDSILRNFEIQVLVKIKEVQE